MKRLLLGLLSLFFIANVWAANTATDQGDLDITVDGSGPVSPITVVIDTTATDLTIVDPASNKMACIVGWVHSEGTAVNLTLKSGSTTHGVLELAANQGIAETMGHPLFCTLEGEDLIIQSDTAISYLTLYTIQASRLKIK